MWQPQKLEAIGSLAAEVAHEFNNILDIIRLEVGAALESESAEFARDSLRNIAEAAASDSRITNQLLNLSKSREPRFTLMNMRAIIQRALGLVRQGMKNQGIKVIEKLGDLFDVLVDAQLMEQVVINILTNTRHAMDMGGTLTIRSERHGDQDSIIFSDTGKGIPEADLSRVFDPFFSTKGGWAAERFPGRASGLRSRSASFAGIAGISPLRASWA